MQMTGGNMSSISEIGDVTLASFSDSTFSTPTKHIPPVPPMEDQVQIAAVPSSVQVEQLQSSSPSSFQAVVADAILKLRAAALHSTDPAEVTYLSDLADRFQLLEEDGQASGLSITPQNLSSSAS
jgi:hypothetical protein